MILEIEGKVSNLTRLFCYIECLFMRNKIVICHADCIGLDTCQTILKREALKEALR